MKALLSGERRMRMRVKRARLRRIWVGRRSQVG
jgi:hypothetical protein